MQEEIFFIAKTKYDISNIISQDKPELLEECIRQCLERDGVDVEKELFYYDGEDELEVTDVYEDITREIEEGVREFYTTGVSDQTSEITSEPVVVRIAKNEAPKESKAELLRSGFMECWECKKNKEGQLVFGNCPHCQNTGRVPLTPREECFRDMMIDFLKEEKAKK